MKRIIKATALMLVIFTALSLVSCVFHLNFPSKESGEDAVTDGTDAAQQTENGEKAEDGFVIVENDFTETVNKHLASIGRADYEGAAVMIATPKPALISDEECGVVMAETVAMRNALVQDRFNVSVYAKGVDPDTMYAQVFNADRAGDYYADILMVPQYYMSQYVTSGLLLNLNSLPFFDTDGGYNIESGISAGMGAADGYGTAGWATLDADLLSAVFFNRSLIEEAGLESPYELERQGLWTWDKFFEYTAAVSLINEKRAAEGRETVCSYGSQNAAISLADLVFISEGNSFITSGVGIKPTVAVTYESSLHAMTTAQTLFNDPNKEHNSLDAINTFAKGGSLFLIDRLGTMKQIATSSAEWGILPLPKGSTEQAQYRTLASNESLMFAVPATSTNPETVSRVMCALNAASLGYMTDAYVTETMYYYLRDNDSVEMVEKICYSAYFDMAYTFGAYNTAIANSTYFAARNVYECNGDMNFYLSRFQTGANTALSRLFPG